MAGPDKTREELTIDTKVTWPDGTSTTTSPSTGGSTGPTVPSGVPTRVESSDSPYQAADGEILVVDSGGGDITVNCPPTPSDGDAFEAALINSTNSLTIDPGSENIEDDSDTLTENETFQFRYYDGFWRTYGGDRSNFEGNAFVDPSGKTIPTNDPIALISDTGGGGGGGGTSGAYKTSLVGSTNQSNRATGFASAVNNAINNGTPVIDVTGHWTHSGTLSFSSTTDGPSNIPIVIDAEGATIEYSGSGWAIHDDNEAAANGGRIPNNVCHIYGGYWTASGDPDGWFRGTDIAGNKIYPDMVRQFENSSGDGVGVQIEEGDLYCEANKVGGNYRELDIGVKGVSPNGVSFQDNFFDNVNLGEINEIGFDLTGNWIDCTILNPTVIADANRVSFLRQNGNMGGTEIICPEFEDANANVSVLFLTDVGPEAGRGPVIRGGDLTLNANNIAIANTEEFTLDQDDNLQGPMGWCLTMELQRSFASPGGEGYCEERYTPQGASRSIRTGTGATEETVPFEHGDNPGGADGEDGIWDPDW